MRTKVLVVTAIAIVSTAIAVWLFPRAIPIVALEQSLTREVALARADSFFRAHNLAPDSARTAVRFEGNDSLRTFVELAGGGQDSLNALVRGDDVAPFFWSVRAFVPGDPREAHVDFAPDGRVIGFEQKLAESDQRPTVSADSGRRLAERAIDEWVDDRADRWRLVASSYETKKTSGRVDRTYTFERTDRRVAGAPIRTTVVVAGDRPSRLDAFVEIPESFRRRYAEMRSWNTLLSLLATIGIVAIGIAGVVTLVRYARTRQVRWRPALLVGGAIGALMLAAGLNAIPGSWFDYDTALSPTTFLATQLLSAFFFGAVTTLLVGFTLAAAEVATRHAFPEHLDWWKLWRHRGTREVAAHVGGGYAVAAIAFAYVATFYVVTRAAFGWWVPSQILDDPNQIASPLPWVTGIAISTFASVWEEALFRALPLSLIALWIGDRPQRRWWMIAAVVVSALIFGFAHSDYESWPPYSRGVEIFLDACFWAVLFIVFGLLVTIVAHFVYDAVLFGIFAAAGDAPPYRVTLAIVVAALVAPAIAVLWRAVRQRGLVAAPAEARFASWTPLADDAPAPSPPPTREGITIGARGRQLAIAAAIAGVVVAVGRPPRPTLGPEFTASRADVVQTADSLLRAQGGDPEAWKRLTGIGTDTLDQWPRFVRQHELIGDARRLASTYAPPVWWTVRYVRTTGAPAERTEEWRVRIRPDGTPLDARHIIPDSAARPSADSAAARRIATAALARAGIDTTDLRETELRETARPARRDVTVEYTDTTVALPAGAVAQARVEIAGEEPTVVRREIELPEAFLRADLARQTTRATIGGVAMFALLALVIAGALIVRRRPPVIEGRAFDRRASVVVVGALVLLAMAGVLNSLREALFQYDTAQPWSAFLGTTMIAFMGPAVVTLVMFGLLLVLDGLRRRVGVPLAADDSLPAARRDTLAAGLGLGGALYAAVNLDALVARDAMPRLPATTLNDFVPMLSGVADVPSTAIITLISLAIPMTVVAGLSSRWSVRLVVGVILAALGAVMVWSFEQPGAVNPLRVSLAIAGAVVATIAIVSWGRVAALSWVVGAFVYGALAELRQVVYAVGWEGKVAAAMAMTFALALCLGVVWSFYRSAGQRNRVNLR